MQEGIANIEAYSCVELEDEEELEIKTKALNNLFRMSTNSKTIVLDIIGLLRVTSRVHKLTHTRRYCIEMSLKENLTQKVCIHSLNMNQFQKT